MATIADHTKEWAENHQITEDHLQKNKEEVQTMALNKFAEENYASTKDAALVDKWAANMGLSIFPTFIQKTGYIVHKTAILKEAKRLQADQDAKRLQADQDAKKQG